MNCLKFKSGFESREDLAGEMLNHADSCEECARFVTEERALTGFLSELPQSTAPNNFGQAVKTRIAENKGNGAWFWPVARIAIPAAAMVVIVGFVVMNSDLIIGTAPDDKPIAIGNDSDSRTNPDSNRIEAIPEIVSEIDKEPEKTDLPAVETQPRISVEKPATEKTKREMAVKERKTDISPVSKKGGSLDSLDQAFEEPETVNPPGIEPDKEVEIKQKVPAKVFNSKEILAALGLGTTWRNGRLVVLSVSKNSVAQRAGVKLGDEIRSIDGRKVNQATSSSGRVKGRVLKVLRTGTEITINIGAKK